MPNFTKPFELRNIKNNPDGYQIQFIVDGKSHSSFSTDIEKAKEIRDKMEKKLKRIPNGAFKAKPNSFKLSFVPGTDKLMASGVNLRVARLHDSESYEVAVNWRDHTGKTRIKTFYACSETRYTLFKMRDAYKRGLEFRKAYEKAVLDETLADFDPSSFNKTAQLAINKEKSKITTILRAKARKRKR